MKKRGLCMQFGDIFVLFVILFAFSQFATMRFY